MAYSSLYLDNDYYTATSSPSHWDVYSRRSYGSSLTSPVLKGQYTPDYSRAATPPPSRGQAALNETRYATPPSYSRWSNTYDTPASPRSYFDNVETRHTASYAALMKSRPPPSSPRYGASPIEQQYNLSPRASYGVNSSSGFIASQNTTDQSKYTVVLDLDETLVYARAGPVRQRPGCQQLMRALANSVEAVLWTAGEKNYAMNAVRQIDNVGAIKHTIARDSRWYTGDRSCVKDLRMLGRDLNKSILIENTPDCIRNNTENSILLPDFLGGSDSVIPTLQMVLEELVRSGMPVQEYLRNSPHLVQRTVRCNSGETITAYTLKGHDPTVPPQPSYSTGGGYGSYSMGGHYGYSRY